MTNPVTVTQADEDLVTDFNSGLVNGLTTFECFTLAEMVARQRIAERERCVAAMQAHPYADEYTDKIAQAIRETPNAE